MARMWLPHIGHVSYLCASALLFCLAFPAFGSHPRPATASVRELYVKTVKGTCPSDPRPCYTLDQYVENSTQYFANNTEFKFMPGNHALNDSQSINVTRVVNLSLVPYNYTQDIAVEIDCRSNSIHFTAIANLTLKGLTFSNCHSNPINFTAIANLTLEGLTFSNCDDLTMDDILNLRFVRINITTDAYLLAYKINALGSSTIANVSVNTEWDFPLTISYKNSSIWPRPIHNTLTITGFLGNDGSLDGIMLFDVQLLQPYGLNLLFENVTIMYTDVNIAIDSTAYNNITMNHVAFVIDDWDSIVISERKMSNTSVLITNSNLTQKLRFDSTLSNLKVENSTIGSSITLHGVGCSVNTSITFSNCEFANFNDTDYIVHPEPQQVNLIDVSNVIFINCNFSDSIGTPVTARNSKFTLSGLIMFRNNHALKGGAMAFYGESYVTFANGADIRFVNNSAEEVGGAIFVDYSGNTLCFFKLEGHYRCSPSYNDRCFPSCDDRCDTAPIIHDKNFSVSFENNTAGIGGEKIYGAFFDKCQVDSCENCYGWNIGSAIFGINITNNSDLSAITSDPMRVCLCDHDGKPNCTKIFGKLTNRSKPFPGGLFNISAVLVGDRFGTVRGSVYAQLLPDNTHDGTKLGSLQYSQNVIGSCTNLTYSILSNTENEKLQVHLVLKAESIPTNIYPNQNLLSKVNIDTCCYKNYGQIIFPLSSFPVYVTITLRSCPLGFKLNKSSSLCDCDPQLKKHGIQCNINTQTVQRSGSEWINASFNGNTSDGVIINMYCPNDYCRVQTIDVNLSIPDTQCDFNRSGILCGGCQSGLSLALGSDQCLHCSNDYLALIIPFALAGVALILVVKFFNLTVAQGTINGLIFYANVVRANQAAWLPRNSMPPLFTVFIAWLNLDLGIETCFFDGLDAYWKTWFQFLFPLYIWVMMILIVVLSRFFSCVSKFLGNNSVPILATLFLLSYSKLLRTTIAILQSSMLQYSDNSKVTVWTYDGNIAYLDPKHLVLLVMALLVIFVLCLPYTGILLSAQWLQASNLRIAKLLVRLKPFFDAYFGPFKDSHRFWVGFLLLTRVVLFSVYAVTVGDSNVDFLVTAVASFVLLKYPTTGHYRRHWLNLLENSFLVNLGLLAVGTIYIKASDGNQGALASTSVGVAFVEFLVIIVYHTYKQLRDTESIRRLKAFCCSNPQHNQVDYEPIPEEPAVNNPRGRELYLSFSNYREPVLKYLDNQ